MKWWLFFVFIQLINIPLMVMGWVICLYLPLAKFLWLWWNDDDPPKPGTSWWSEYVWLAWRNPVANLRRIPGVAGAGRPLIYHWWHPASTGTTDGWYVKIGWESGAPYYPVMSAGSGRGY
jgi:uncharacterized membrane-anchored protein YitT (DUF2179 family)